MIILKIKKKKLSSLRWTVQKIMHAKYGKITDDRSICVVKNLVKSIEKIHNGITAFMLIKES